MISCHASPVAHLGERDKQHVTHATFARKPSPASELHAGTPEEEQHGLREGLEVVVPVDVRAVHHGHLPKHLKRSNRTNTLSCGRSDLRAAFCPR